MSVIQEIECMGLLTSKHREECLVCKILSNAPSNIDCIARLACGSVFLHEDQCYRGRCIYTFHEHYESISEVATELFARAATELHTVCRAVSEVLAPDLLNVAMLGNHERHLHWHVIPRYRNDANWGNPPWPSVPHRLSQPDYLQLVSSLRTRLQKAKR